MVKHFADEAFEVFFAARNRVEFYDDVRPSLLRLHSRYRLFALSNGNADLQRCGIGDLFTGHVTASAAGAAKPDARIFARQPRERKSTVRRISAVSADSPLMSIPRVTVELDLFELAILNIRRLRSRKKSKREAVIEDCRTCS